MQLLIICACRQQALYEIDHQPESFHVYHLTQSRTLSVQMLEESI